jgi:hypothetical protein
VAARGQILVGARKESYVEGRCLRSIPGVSWQQGRAETYSFTGRQISRQMDKIWDTNERLFGYSVEVKFVEQNIEKLDR